MPGLVIPEGATPADLFGDTDLLPGQDWLEKETLLNYAHLMAEGHFPWRVMQEDQPMAVEVGTNGKVISQRHHRWAAARLTGVVMPVDFEYRYDYLENGQAVPYALTWDAVIWKKAYT